MLMKMCENPGTESIKIHFITREKGKQKCREETAHADWNGR
jgi:hypothetical protein